MKRFKHVLKLIFLLLVFNPSTNIVIANNKDKPSRDRFDFRRRLSREQCTQDLAILNNLLKELHPGIYLHVSEKKYSDIVDSLAKSLSKPLNIREFYSPVTALLAVVRDGHTWENWENTFEKQLRKENRPLFPLEIQKIGENIYVSENFTTEKNIKSGDKIIAINNQPVSSIYQVIETHTSVEGYNKTALNLGLDDFPIQYFLLCDTAKTFKIEVESGEGRRSFMLKGIPLGFQEKLQAKNTAKPISYKLKDSIAILTVKTFHISEFEESKIEYKNYLRNFFSLLKTRRISKLIIDLRGNSGGDPEISQELYSYLAKDDFHYFAYAATKINKIGNWKRYIERPTQLPELDSTLIRSNNGLYVYPDSTIYKRKRNGYNGKVVALIDGGCFSTTGHFVSLLKYYHTATLIGEASQGSYYSNDGSQYFTLPNSKINIRIPLAQWKMDLPSFTYSNSGIEPDIVVTINPEDLATHFDRQLNSALKFFKPTGIYEPN